METIIFQILFCHRTQCFSPYTLAEVGEACMPHLTLAHSALKATSSKYSRTKTSLQSHLGHSDPDVEPEEHEALDTPLLLEGLPKQDVHNSV